MSLLILFGRCVFISAKPISLALAAYIFSSDRILLFTTILAVLPVITAAASAPVHRDLYLSLAASPAINNRLYSEYVSAILVVSLILYLVVFIFGVLFFEEITALVLLLPLLFVMDKVFDEVMRFQEFKRNFLSWILSGVLRNTWCYFFILAYIITDIISDSLAYAVFFQFLISVFFAINKVKNIYHLAYINWRDGFFLIRKSLVFYIGGFYKVLMRNIDKVLISFLAIPGSAYIVLLSMVISTIYIIGDALILAPRRRLITKHPVFFIAVIDGFINKRKTYIYMLFICITIVSVAGNDFYFHAAGFMLITALVGIYTMPLQEVYFWFMSPDSFIKTYILQFLILIVCCFIALLLANTVIGSYLPLIIPLFLSIIFVLCIRRSFRNEYSKKSIISKL